MPVIDSDQHLVEYRGMWEELIEPSHRDDAIRMVDDELGYTTLVWNGTTLGLVDVQSPGDTKSIGDRRRDWIERRPARLRYDDHLPDDHWSPTARIAALDDLGVDEAVLFPNYGLLWERTLDQSPVALLANMAAWNRWCTMVVAEGRGRLHPVAHVTLRDLDWLEGQLRSLSAAGIRLAMMSPGLVDGRPLSDPALDRAWSLFIEFGVTPVFHVADQTRPFDDAWYTDAGPSVVPTLESVFLWTGAALACTDLVVNGVLERHPDLRIGIVELSAVWLPMYVLMLDGGVEFTTKLNGRAPAELSMRPSEYIYRQVRVSSFSYELPARLIRQLGERDILMCCSDYPHSEGTATPIADYAAGISGAYPIEPGVAPAFFGENMAMLLRR